MSRATDKEKIVGDLKKSLALENTEFNEESIMIEDIEKEVIKRFNDGVCDEYLVDGAILRCNKATWDDFEMSDGSKVHLDKMEEKKKQGEPQIALRVWENSLFKDGFRHATVTDTVKGHNIVPFLCNCGMPALKSAQEKIKDNMEECQKYGVCRYLLNPEDEWENIDFNVPYASFSDIQTLGEIGSGQFNYNNDSPRILSEEVKAGITMTSVLFCKNGGFIYPVTSGQNVITKGNEWAMKILEEYLKGEEDEEQAQLALELLAAQMSDNLPEYVSRSGLDYNKYDTYILGWTEYYNNYYGYQYKVDAVYTKAQCYIESRLGKDGGIPTTNTRNDIMQELDIKNGNIYDYVGISVYQFSALTSNGSYERGSYFWDMNRPGDKYPDGSQYNSDKAQRCGGIISTLFTENQDGSGECFYENSKDQYYLQLEKVTPIMSLGVGLDKMMVELQKSGGDYRRALEEYNGGGNKKQYADSIIDIATQSPPINLE